MTQAELQSANGLIREIHPSAKPYALMTYRGRTVEIISYPWYESDGNIRILIRTSIGDLNSITEVLMDDLEEIGTGSTDVDSNWSRYAAYAIVVLSVLTILLYIFGKGLGG